MIRQLIKDLLQAGRYFRNWRAGSPEKATAHGRKYLILFLFGGFAILWVLYEQGIAVPSDFALFGGGVILIDTLQFGTLIRLGMLIDPMTGGILGAIGLGTLTKFVRDLGGVSAAISYFKAIRD